MPLCTVRSWSPDIVPVVYFVSGFQCRWEKKKKKIRSLTTATETRWGLGLHAEYFPAANVKQFSKVCVGFLTVPRAMNECSKRLLAQVQYVGGPLYAMSLLGFKVSLLASYLRIGGFVKVYRAIIIGAIVAVVVNQVIFTFLFIFPCRPVWSPRPHTSKP